jgi:hypothetical protein
VQYSLSAFPSKDVQGWLLLLAPMSCLQQQNSFAGKVIGLPLQSPPVQSSLPFALVEILTMAKLS